MPRLTSERGVTPFRRRLYLPAYMVSDAARYARISAQSVAYWHYGGGQLGPALPSRERRRPLSYMELIEVAFVAFFRNMGVSLQRIRRAREFVAQTFNAEYPFVEHRFKSEGFHVLMDFDIHEGVHDFEPVIVADAAGQLAWEKLLSDKFAEFDYEPIDDGKLALKWHPVGRQSPVTIDPRVSFGAPTIKGIPTWTLKGRWNAGESLEDIQEDFGLAIPEIRSGLKFEGIVLAA